MGKDSVLPVQGALVRELRSHIPQLRADAAKLINLKKIEKNKDPFGTFLAVQ